MHSEESVVVSARHQVSRGVYQYDFTGGSRQFDKGARLRINRFSMYNCVYNVSSELGNNTMKIIWIDGTEYDIVIDDMFLDETSFLQLIVYQCKGLGLYYTTSIAAGAEDQFPFDFVINTARYAFQMTCFAIPSGTEALANGYTKSGSWSWPTVATTPQIYLNAKLASMLGFAGYQTMPPTPQSTNYSLVSPNVPDLQYDAKNIILMCDQVLAGKSVFGSRVCTSMEIDKSFGGFLSVAPVMQTVPLREGTTNSLTFRVFSDSEQPLAMRDPVLHIFATIIYNNDNSNDKRPMT